MRTRVGSSAGALRLSPRSLPQNGSQVRRMEAQPTQGSEEEMVSCPDRDELSTTTLTALRASLAEVLAAQQKNVAALQATVDDLTGETDVDSVRARDVAESFIVRGVDVIADIQHALLRIEKGMFGTCERCGNPISLERLEAIPYARRCVTCPSPAPSLLG